MALSATSREKFAQRRLRLAKHAEAFSSLTPEEKIGYIPFGHAPTEFEIQAFLYSELSILGLQIRGEAATKCGTARFDLVIYENGIAVRIVEVKKQKRGACNHKQQFSRYGAFGIPVDTVFCLKNAKRYLEAIRDGGIRQPSLQFIG